MWYLRRFQRCPRRWALPLSAPAAPALRHGPTSVAAPRALLPESTAAAPIAARWRSRCPPQTRLRSHAGAAHERHSQRLAIPHRQLLPMRRRDLVSVARSRCWQRQRRGPANRCYPHPRGGVPRSYTTQPRQYAARRGMLRCQRCQATTCGGACRLWRTRLPALPPRGRRTVSHIASTRR